MMNKRQGRPFSALPHCYYEGYLEKRSFKDKKSRRLWTCLCGNALYFFNDKREIDYIEKLDLSGPITITDDTTMDYNLDTAKMNLQTKDSNIKFSAPNAEARELWKGFIQSVVELSVPSTLNLLPGQMLMLEEVVKKEKERLRTFSPTSVVESIEEMPDCGLSPSCFHLVTRTEAELLLEREASRGNLLLRPSQDGTGFAISTREEMNGPIFKHYRVSHNHDDGFTIEVDNPVQCASLLDIINYFSEVTEGMLKPLVREETYEQNISYVGLDNENGEKRVRGASMHLLPPAVQPKPALARATSEDVEENVYVNDKNPKDFAAERPPETDTKLSGKSLKAPTPAPRKFPPSPSPPSTTRSTHSRELRTKTHLDQHNQTISELTMMFKKMAKCVE
ncbi:signal-transducing adaptor protein 1-like isoform X2 [Syngnathoides biaculeatus]|uniref:signal-transducing adaptor protein 1-like isoform X2 n=1 Tax=Syngnathoides biaculeatus TaxID=300417 RepID=UPI002ADD7DD4|nr:signal-transducing adaptor protein 1-like isoform X2 [Syngnathoides biaculeatus]